MNRAMGFSPNQIIFEHTGKQRGRGGRANWTMSRERSEESAQRTPGERLRKRKESLTLREKEGGEEKKGCSLYLRSFNAFLTTGSSCKGVKLKGAPLECPPTITRSVVTHQRGPLAKTRSVCTGLLFQMGGGGYSSVY